jgi:hypothetical protein
MKEFVLTSITFERDPFEKLRYHSRKEGFGLWVKGWCYGHNGSSTHDMIDYFRETVKDEAFKLHTLIITPDNRSKSRAPAMIKELEYIAREHNTSRKRRY